MSDTKDDKNSGVLKNMANKSRASTKVMAAAATVMSLASGAFSSKADASNHEHDHHGHDHHGHDFREGNTYRIDLDNPVIDISEQDLEHETVKALPELSLEAKLKMIESRKGGVFESPFKESKEAVVIYFDAEKERDGIKDELKGFYDEGLLGDIEHAIDFDIVSDLNTSINSTLDSHKAGGTHTPSVASDIPLSFIKIGDKVEKDHTFINHEETIKFVELNIIDHEIAHGHGVQYGENEFDIFYREEHSALTAAMSTARYIDDPEILDDYLMHVENLSSGTSEKYNISVTGAMAKELIKNNHQEIKDLSFQQIAIMADQMIEYAQEIDYGPVIEEMQIEKDEYTIENITNKANQIANFYDRYGADTFAEKAPIVIDKLNEKYSEKEDILGREGENLMYQSQIHILELAIEDPEAFKAGLSGDAQLIDDIYEQSLPHEGTISLKEIKSHQLSMHKFARFAEKSVEEMGLVEQIKEQAQQNNLEQSAADKFAEIEEMTPEALRDFNESLETQRYELSRDLRSYADTDLTKDQYDEVLNIKGKLENIQEAHSYINDGIENTLENEVEQDQNIGIDRS